MPNRVPWSAAGLALLLGMTQGALAQDAHPHLPPILPWEGRSETLIVSDDDPWQTPAERDGLQSTPSFAESVAWLERLVAASDQLSLQSIGQSLEGRELWMVLASSDGRLDESSAGRKPLLLVHAGIHAGEIDGKDAGFMLLRDLAVKGKHPELLEAVDLLFIPMINPDGHERVGPYNRPNQRGPERMGWRTNARNQNLNRDFTKLDTPPVRALVDLMHRWNPDLYLDLHVTDGADYQYDITFGGNGMGGWSPAIGQWLESVYRPAVSRDLEAWDHIPGSLVFAANGMDMEDGFLTWTGEPRYSNGYGDARHLPAILVENHSLKPYRQRVLGTYVLLEATLRLLATEGASLREAVARDQARRPDPLTLAFARTPSDPANARPFKGVRSERYEGPVTGGTRVRWTGEAETRDRIEVFIDTPAARASRPTAYLIPPAWADVAERLRWHGIAVETLAEPTMLEVDITRLPDAKLAEPAGWTPNPFEGRVRMAPGEPATARTEVAYPAGTFRVATDQPLGDLAMLLLEPNSPDSFFQWGFFLEILNRTEYVEGYLMEPLAQAMLDEDPTLAAAFLARKQGDEAFAGDPQAQLRWFFERTPYYDDRYRVYPVGRLP